MATAAAPRGIATQLLFKDEVSYGVLPSGNWTPTLFYTHSLEEKEPYQDDNVIGQAQNNNRDVNAPEPGLPQLAGDLDVPLDLAHVGYWLRMLFGAPSTSGSSPNFIHVWNSGSEVLPHRSLEMKLASNLFYQYTGLLAGGFSVDVSKAAGFEHIMLKMMGRREAKTTSSVGGTPTAIIARETVVKAIAQVKIAGSLTGDLLTIKGDYDNGAVPQDFLGDTYPLGHDLDNPAKWGGAITARFRNATIYDLARIKGSQSLEILWSNNANRSLSLFSTNCRLEPFGVPIAGTGAIQSSFNFRAEQSSSAPMLTATLKSPTATF